VNRVMPFNRFFAHPPYGIGFQTIISLGPSTDRTTVPSLISILTKNGSLTELDLSAARAITESTKQSMEEFLISHDMISRSDWLKALSDINHIPIEQLNKNNNEETAIAPEIARLIPPQLAFPFLLLPLRIEEGKLLIGISHLNKDVLLLAESVSGYKIEPRLMDPEVLKKQLEILYKEKPDTLSLQVPRLEQVIRVQDLVTSHQLEQAKEEARYKGNCLERQLVQMDFLGEADLLELMSLQTGIPYVYLIMRVLIKS